MTQNQWWWTAEDQIKQGDLIAMTDSNGTVTRRIVTKVGQQGIFTVVTTIADPEDA